MRNEAIALDILIMLLENNFTNARFLVDQYKKILKILNESNDEINSSKQREEQRLKIASKNKKYKLKTIKVC